MPVSNRATAIVNVFLPELEEEVRINIGDKFYTEDGLIFLSTQHLKILPSSNQVKILVSALEPGELYNVDAFTITKCDLDFVEGVFNTSPATGGYTTEYLFDTDPIEIFVFEKVQCIPNTTAYKTGYDTGYNVFTKWMSKRTIAYKILEGPLGSIGKYATDPMSESKRVIIPIGIFREKANFHNQREAWEFWRKVKQEEKSELENLIYNISFSIQLKYKKDEMKSLFD